MTAVEVRVTAEHIAHGTAHDCEQCPIALAITSMYPGSTGVGVYSGGVFIDYPGTYLLLPLTEDAREFVERFDLGLPVKPFTFVTRESL